MLSGGTNSSTLERKNENTLYFEWTSNAQLIAFIVLLCASAPRMTSNVFKENALKPSCYIRNYALGNTLQVVPINHNGIADVVDFIV